MEAYIREQSFGEIIRNTFRIYIKNFPAIFLAYFLVMIPFQILTVIGIESNNILALAVGSLMQFPVALFATAVITLLIADICIGNETNLLRYYKRVFGKILWRLFGTNLLQTLIILVGIVFLIVPGIVFMLWLMYSGSIVVLEEKYTVQALKRSKELGKGYYLRSLGVLIVILLVCAVCGGIMGGVFAVVTGGHASPLETIIFNNVVQLLFAPVGMIAVILMYYDLRVRKEAYNNDVLAEELLR